MTQAELDDCLRLAHLISAEGSYAPQADAGSLARAVVALSTRLADLQSELKVAIISRDAAEEWNAKLRLQIQRG